MNCEALKICKDVIDCGECFSANVDVNTVHLLILLI